MSWGQLQVFTIGHSNRSEDRFLELLTQHDIKALVDVRTKPYSRYCPQFNQNNLKNALLKCGINYHHNLRLGGLRTQGLNDSPNTAWKELSFRHFADHMLSTDFELGVQELRSLCNTKLALMCAEADYTNCHRQMVSDYLVAQGATVAHITDQGVKNHELSPWAKVKDGQVTYPGSINKTLF